MLAPATGGDGVRCAQRRPGFGTGGHGCAEGWQRAAVRAQHHVRHSYPQNLRHDPENALLQRMVDVHVGCDWQALVHTYGKHPAVFAGAVAHQRRFALQPGAHARALCIVVGNDGSALQRVRGEPDLGEHAAHLCLMVGLAAVRCTTQSQLTPGKAEAVSGPALHHRNCLEWFGR